MWFRCQRLTSARGRDQTEIHLREKYTYLAGGQFDGAVLTEDQNVCPKQRCCGDHRNPSDPHDLFLTVCALCPGYVACYTFVAGIESGRRHLYEKTRVSASALHGDGIGSRDDTTASFTLDVRFQVCKNLGRFFLRSIRDLNQHF